MKNVFDFLKLLCVNNNREWFDSNRAYYKTVKEEFEGYVEALIQGVRQFDESIQTLRPRDCTFRINRDTRFSNDKSPYKNNMGAFITPKGKGIAGAGYYLHIEPDNSFIAGGIYLPPSDVLLKIRTSIYHHPLSLLDIINDASFIEEFGSIDGETLKTAPKGFPKDFEHINLLKYKSFTISHKLTDDFVENDNVVGKALYSFKRMSDFNKYLNKCLD